MQKQILSLLLVTVSLIVSAQSNPEKYAAIITKESLQKQLTVIAGPGMEGRETGTEGQRKAANYIVSQFKAFGLTAAPGTDNFQQYYAIGYDSLLNSELITGDKTLLYGKDYADETSLNNNGKVQANTIVFVGYGISDTKYDDYTDKEVKGKIVVFFTSEPRLQDGNYLITGNRNYSTWTYPGGLSQKAAIAKQKGAVAAIVINTNLWY